MINEAQNSLIHAIFLYEFFVKLKTTLCHAILLFEFFELEPSATSWLPTTHHPHPYESGCDSE